MTATNAADDAGEHGVHAGLLVSHVQPKNFELDMVATIGSHNNKAMFQLVGGVAAQARETA